MGLARDRMKADRMKHPQPVPAATYREIMRYVFDHYGLSLQTAWIAEVKREHGLSEVSSRPSTNKYLTQMCPPDRWEAIEDALRHFGMIETIAPPSTAKAMRQLKHAHRKNKIMKANEAQGEPMTETPPKPVRRPLSGPRSAVQTAGGVARDVQVNIPKDLIKAVDRWIATRPEPQSRADAVRFALREWLTTQGVIEA